ncbi:MAG: hypothetical protein ABI666_12505 [Ferruginibacter sp.]
MESAYKNLGYFFIILFVFVIWVFSKSYIKILPVFKDVSFVYHFHGTMLLSWMLLLIIQPFLIRYKKYKWHKFLGKVSYILVPLIVVSIFLVSKEKYIRLSSSISKEENIGMIALNIPGMVYFAVLYLLAMINRKNSASHMRYMIATALLVFGPAAGRALEFYGSLSFDRSVFYSVLIIEILTLGLIIYDLIKKAPFRPYLLTMLFLFAFHITWLYKSAPWWQQIGGFFADHFFLSFLFIH